jgi:hypothetical protein
MDLIDFEFLIQNFFNSNSFFYGYDYIQFPLFLVFSISISIWIGLVFNRRKVSLLNWIIFCGLSVTIINVYGFIILKQILMIFSSADEESFYYNLGFKIFTIRLISSILIYNNIKNRNMKEWIWTLAAYYNPVIAIPLYFIVRNKKQEGLPSLVDEKQNNEEDVKPIKEVLKSCPNCKSINSKNLSECEYCDVNLEII